MTRPFDFSGLVDRRVLQAERDIARAERRAEQAEQALTAATQTAKSELAREHDRVQTLQAELNGVYTSTSWRFSRPLRIASRLLQTLREPASSPSPLPDAPAAPAQAPLLTARERAILQRLQRRTRN